MNAPLDSRHAALLKTFGESALAKVGHRFTPDAEGLKAVVRRTPAYAEFDDASHLLVVTRRSLVLALLEEGRQGTSAMPNGNAAMWLARWIDTQLGFALIEPSGFAQSAEALERAVEQKVGVAVHPEVETVMEEALQFAHRVRTKSARARGFALRHLVALCLRPVERGGLLGRAALDLNQPIGEANLQRCRDAFLPWVTSSLPSGETATLWRSAFPQEMRLPGATTGAPATPLAPAEPLPPLVTTFAPDRPASDPDGPDPLRINKDVTAFARLIAHRDTSTPLAIGVFGAWGSGKSTFMERLEKSIDQLAKAGREGAETDGFVAGVVHVRFNAWSFADANLWASLGAEFFDQLRVGGHSKKGEDIHATLVERVTTHVHDLKSTAEATRSVAQEGESRLVEAQRKRDGAVKAARNDRKAAIPQAMLDGLARAHEAFAGEFGGHGQDLTGLIKRARTVQTSWGRGAMAVATLWGGGWRTVVPAALLLAGGIGVMAALRQGWLQLDGKALAAAVGPGLLGLVAALGSGLRLASRFAAETAGFAGQLEKGEEARVAEVLEAELALKDAAEEAEARRKAADRATRALSRYIDPKGTSNPPRLLRYVLEDDPATRALEKEIGLISRTRRLFEAVEEILRVDRETRAKGGVVDPNTPERIVIYIDDLDRCTQEQVQSVLQAVHLLLAFEAFVVVVGVDQTRVAEALARQFDTDDDPKNDTKEEIDRRMDRAVLYLEKIFQLAFRLKPLSPAGDDGGAYSSLVGHLIGQTEEEAEAAKAAKAARAEAVKAAADAMARAEAAKAEAEAGEGELAKLAKQMARTSPSIETPPIRTPPPTPPEPRKATAKQALETLMIGDTEARFLRSVAIGTVAGSTPRNVKRMLNVYRLARVRLAEDGFDLTGKGGGRPLYPLLALFAALDTGREPKVAKKAFDALRVDATELGDIVHLAMPDDDTMITQAVVDAYGAMPTAADCRHVADLVRRYSFNALDD